MMHHWRIALTSAPLLQRQRPIWRLCRTRRHTRSRRCMPTMLFCHGSAERCLEQVKIAPTNPTFLAPIGHGVCRHDTTPSADHTRRSSNHEQIDGMVSAPGGLGWWHCKFLWGTQKKLMLLAMAGSRWEIGWFGVNFWTQTSTKIPLESSDQGLSIGVIKIWWFPCEIIW
jgi:hypothetical protein